MVEKEHPLITVVIPTYKRIKKLNRAINSVYNQTYDNIELIIVNDDPNSNIDNLIDLKKNVIIINHKQNQGPSVARNSGIQRAKGDYIAFLDNDDFFLNNKIERMVNTMKSLSNEWVGVYSWYFEEKSGVVIRSYAEGDLSLPLLKCNIFLAGGSSLLLKLETVKAIGGFNPSFRIFEDWEFILRICKMGKIKLITEPLFVVDTSDQHQSNISPEKHLESRLKYLKTLSPLINSYGIKLSKQIHTTQYLRVAYHFLQERKILIGLKLMYKIFKYSPLDFFSEFLGYFKRRILNE